MYYKVCRECGGRNLMPASTCRRWKRKGLRSKRRKPTNRLREKPLFLGRIRSKMGFGPSRRGWRKLSERK